jgi:hypothetical protein
MTVSLYEVTIPAFKRGLGNLSHLLDKGAAHTAAKKIDPRAFLDARVFPDMLPFTKQVQIACDMVKGCAARLANIENPRFEDTEATFDQLTARVHAALEFVGSVTPEQLAGAEVREIVLTIAHATRQFTGLTYVSQFVLPNFYFHSSMVYALLRAGGVEIGKSDFLGPLQ